MSNVQLTKTAAFSEYIPRVGLIYHKDSVELILCKPKLMPLKSLTMEKLEKVQHSTTADVAAPIHRHTTESA
jgi:BBSome-interacting protein 1